MRKADMEQNAIFSPFFVMILLTFVVWIYMYSRRIPFIRSSQLTSEQLTPTEFARISPPQVANPSDNLKNLFEIPTIFYAVALFLYVTGQVDTVYLVLSWVFVVFRIAHSIVHCTVNIVLLRFWLYAVSTLALGVLTVRAAVVYFFS
jgi:hypothetical protein